MYSYTKAFVEAVVATNEIVEANETRCFVYLIDNTYQVDTIM